MSRLCCTSNYNRFRKVSNKLLLTCNRQLSSRVPANENTNKEGKNDSFTLLYKRNPDRNVFAKASLLISSLNTTYWIWYIVDFVPTVNSTIGNIYPVWSYGCLGVSIFIQSAFTIYPLSLVSKISYRSTTSSNAADRLSNKDNASQIRPELLVWRHTLPFLRISSKPLIFPVGSLAIDMNSKTTHTILEDLDGNIGNFEGHLALKRVSDEKTGGEDSSSSITMKLPLIVDIQNQSEVYDSELMLYNLLPMRVKKQDDYIVDENSRGMNENDTKDRNKFHQMRSRHRKKKRNRGKK